MVVKKSLTNPISILVVYALLLAGCSGEKNEVVEYYSMIALLAGKESIQGEYVGTTGYLQVRDADSHRLYLSKQDLVELRFSNSIAVYNFTKEAEVLELRHAALCYVEGRNEMHSGVVFLFEVGRLDCRFDAEGNIRNKQN